MKIPPKAMYTMVLLRLGLSWELTKSMMSRFERTVRLSIALYLLCFTKAPADKYCQLNPKLSRVGLYAALTDDSLLLHSLLSDTASQSMAEHKLRIGYSSSSRRDLSGALLAHLLVSDGFEELSDPEPSGVASCPFCR